MVTRKWKVYGREGHRQRESYNEVAFDVYISEE